MTTIEYNGRMNQLLMSATEIGTSSEEERRQYVEQRFRCIANCESCGNCRVLRGKSADEAYADYIAGKASFVEVSMRLRQQ